MNVRSILLIIGLVVLGFGLFGKLLGMSLKIALKVGLVGLLLVAGWYFVRDWPIATTLFGGR